jgi:hypothetical protein
LKTAKINNETEKLLSVPKNVEKTFTYVTKLNGASTGVCGIAKVVLISLLYQELVYVPIFFKWLLHVFLVQIIQLASLFPLLGVVKFSFIVRKLSFLGEKVNKNYNFLI